MANVKVKKVIAFFASSLFFFSYFCKRGRLHDKTFTPFVIQVDKWIIYYLIYRFLAAEIRRSKTFCSMCALPLNARAYDHKLHWRAMSKDTVKNKSKVFFGKVAAMHTKKKGRETKEEPLYFSHSRLLFFHIDAMIDFERSRTNAFSCNVHVHSMCAVFCMRFRENTYTSFCAICYC